MSHTALIFSPHPDDAEFFAGGTLAGLARQGWRVLIVTVTDGRCGSFEFSGQAGAEALARQRAAEAQRAAAILGAELLMLGYPDLGLDSLPPGQLRADFIRVLRQQRPRLVIAEDMLAAALGEIHPDHRAVAAAASDALALSALPLACPEQLAENLDVHFVAEKYFYGAPPEHLNKFVDITATMDTKLAALAAHETQMRFLVEDVRRQAAIAGLDASAFPPLAADDPMLAVAWAMRSEAAAAGSHVNMTYAEAYRYVRFHPMIEALIAGNS